MKKVRVYQEVRKMRFEELYELRTQKRLTVTEAAELLGVHERTFRRWSRRYEDQGEEGLGDKRLDKVAYNAAPVDEVVQVLNLFQTSYPNFNVSHFYDMYRFKHEGKRSYSWVKRTLQDAGIIKKSKKKGGHRKKRDRRPVKGMMIHQDGSTHEWVEGKIWDLIVTMDDADNEIYSAFFVEEEGTFSSFQGVKEVIEKHGLFCSLYTDRGTHYWHTPKAGGKVDKAHLTQFRRAMTQLGIDMIAAYSPEARGRSERMFKTFQERLPKELKLAGITDMISANQFLKETFLPLFNKRFKVIPAEAESAFIPWKLQSLELDDILCYQEERVVKKDNTISYKGELLQIPRNNHRYSYQKAVVRVHHYIDDTMAIFYGHRCLGRYDKNGNLFKKAA